VLFSVKGQYVAQAIRIADLRKELEEVAKETKEENNLLNKSVLAVI
jgi:hypothetical protein